MTHVLVFDSLVRHLGLAPLLANLIAFLVAFLVSFLGHYAWTFRDAREGDLAGWQRSLYRFFAVALTGLALNSVFVFLVVDVLGYPHTAAIVFMVLVVPGLLFLLSKFWAFAPSSVAE